MHTQTTWTAHAGGTACIVVGIVLLTGSPAAGHQRRANVPGVVAGNARFALDLYDELRREPGNRVIAPHSVSTSLAMTWAGARGETAAQMADTLHFDLPPQELHQAFERLQASLGGADDAGPELHIANRIWGDRRLDVSGSFLGIVSSRYSGGFETVDFGTNPEQSLRRINDWVEVQTHDRIVELLQQGDVGSDTVLVLTNAVYFKGAWKTRFDVEHTKEGEFFIDADTSVTVPFMELTTSLPWFEDDRSRVVELPYEGDRLSMVVIVPQARHGLDVLGSSLDVQQLSSYLADLEKGTVRLVMPKFRLKDRVHLEKPLARMGMPLAFSAGADFTGMYEPGGIFIEAVIHQTFIELDEEGTEAAGATAVTMKRGGGPPVVRADHPFLFLIRDRETGTILFLGRCADPS